MHDFDDLKITLRVLTAEFKDIKLNLNGLFWCLPVKYENYQPGDIMSIIYKGFLRGTSTKKKISGFPNSISLKIKTIDRSVHIKLNNKSQITGLTNVNEIKQILVSLLTKIRKANKYFIQYKASPSNKLAHKLLPNYELRTAHLILSCIKEPYLVLNTPKSIILKNVLVNRNFHLGTAINIWEFPKIFKNTNFVCTHSNLTQEKICVSYYLQTTNDAEKTKKKPRVTFTINPSGSVLLTGPNCKIVKDVYEKFIALFNLNIDKITFIK